MIFNFTLFTLFLWEILTRINILWTVFTYRRNKKRNDPAECSSKINSPAKISRLATASTPRSVKILRGNKFSTPCKIIDSNNRTRVTRRSSRIYGLLTGITNPIAYQLNA